jgi:endogenous inhibitor of DNA gyrase (YacG/DUF329 family)
MLFCLNSLRLSCKTIVIRATSGFILLSVSKQRISQLLAGSGLPPPVLERICAREGCGKTFTSHSSTRRYCSKRCRVRAHFVPKPPRKVRSAECPRCKTPFESTNPRRKYCSKRCTYLSANRAWRERRRQQCAV